MELLEQAPDVNVMLLDVVMEWRMPDCASPPASVPTAAIHLKIIIRTGQPGVGPETMVARDYAIDGYLTKGEAEPHPAPSGGDRRVASNADGKAPDVPVQWSHGARPTAPRAAPDEPDRYPGRGANRRPARHRR